LTAVVAVGEERRRAQHFERLALTDPLTGLPNRRHAEHWLGEQARSGAGTMCVAIADLDHFKHVNDTYSHDAGDLVLRRFGQLVQDAVRSNDDRSGAAFAARMGGEEFLIAWCDITLEHAVVRSNQLCERLRATSFADVAAGAVVTASIGVAGGRRPIDPLELLRSADLRLYDAKRAGRDQVVGDRDRIIAR
jgi:diguanylate cyclase (GGDEF)-like protein